MIYEVALVLRPDVAEDAIESVKTIISEVLAQKNGSLLVTDDWGMIRFAQPTAQKITKGHYVYFMYQADASDTNRELERRISINESVIKSLIVKLGENSDSEKLVKNYKTPFSKAHNGTIVETNNTDASGFDVDKDRRRFVRKKNCWFTAKNISADWKDPNTYQWTMNEFGKISPSRITGISRKHQRQVTVTIKQARQMGITSYLTGEFASTL